MGKYTIYEGKFPCKTCKEEVKTIRIYPSPKAIKIRAIEIGGTLISTINHLVQDHAFL